MDKDQYAWAAGLFDGEGCTVLRTRKSRNGLRQYVNPKLSIGQSGDPEVLKKFQGIFNAGCVLGPYYRNGHKPKYMYSVEGRKSVRLILDAMWPYLSTMKIRQAQTVLDRDFAGSIGCEGRIYSDLPRFQPHKHLAHVNGRFVSYQKTEELRKLAVLPPNTYLPPEV